MDLLKQAKGIKKKGIIGLILFFTLIGAIVTFILDIICGIKILSTNWKNKELEDQKIIWGIFCFVILGPISAIVFGSIASNILLNNDSLQNKENNNDNNEENKHNTSN